MSSRLLYYVNSDHYDPQPKNGIYCWDEILGLLRRSDNKRSLVVCSSDIENILDEIYNMVQVLEIYVCEEHLPSQVKDRMLPDYPKVKLVSLNDSNSSWKSSAYHAIASVCDTPDQYDDHLYALKAAYNASTGEKN